MPPGHPSPPDGGAPLEGEPLFRWAEVGDCAGGYRIRPYGTDGERGVGANSVRPWNFALSVNCTGAHCAPLQRNFRRLLAPEGAIGEEAKSVKKRAALLHVLAFCFFDHNFGVPRGEQPLSRAPRPGSSGTFLLLFWSQKRRNNGGRPLKKGSHRKVVTPAGARFRLCFRLF